MLFNSYLFLLVFLPVALAGFYGLRRLGRRWSIAWLVGSSLFFYGFWNPAYLLLIVSTIVVNYAFGSALIRRATKTRLWLGLAFNLSLLGYFKYANFFLESFGALSGADLTFERIVLPLAISFFTFQQISYLLDAYRGKLQENAFLDYCLFVTFFPQLIAGPIVHHQEVLPQFRRDQIGRLLSSTAGVGCLYFAVGLFKKTVIADSLGLLVDPVYADAELGVALSTTAAWVSTFVYGFQIYYDFSGYSDMAIGLGLLFGIRLPLNFDSPYKAANLFDFWRRWHMTLTRFMHTHVYLPLARNAVIPLSPIFAVMITITLGGLWHGGQWTLVLWGFSHAVMLLINHFWNRIKRTIPEGFRTRPVVAAILRTSLPTVAGVAVTFSAAVVSRVLFRAETMDGAANIYSAMLGRAGGTDLPFELSGLAVLGIAVVCGITWLAPNTQEIFARYDTATDPLSDRRRAARRSELLATSAERLGSLTFVPSTRWAVGMGVVVLLGFIGIARTSAFIYFAF